jgi:putative redox protein
MAMDVAYMLTKGRHAYRSLKTRLVADRAPDVPHRITAITIHFEVNGTVPSDAVDRAVQLSRDKYCSVWHSMRQDIEFQVSFAVRS